MTIIVEKSGNKSSDEVDRETPFQVLRLTEGPKCAGGRHDLNILLSVLGQSYQKKKK